MTHKFFTTNITGQNFKIQDVVTLAQQIDIPIVAPRYATGRVLRLLFFTFPGLGKSELSFFVCSMHLENPM